MLKVIPPSKNLGCLGLCIGERFYMDLFTVPKSCGVFVNWFGRKMWVYITGTIKMETKHFDLFVCPHAKKVIYRKYDFDDPYPY